SAPPASLALCGHGTSALGNGSAGTGGDGLGGALYVAGGTATITNSTLFANQAWGGFGSTGYSSAALGFSGGNGGNGLGGALYATARTGIMTGDTSSTQIAHAGGGGPRGAAVSHP